MNSRPPLGRLVGKSRYLMLIGIVGLLAGAVEASFASAINAVHVVVGLLHGEPYETGVVNLMHMLDAFLVAAVLLYVAIGGYGLFIAPLEDVPRSLAVSSLDGLKARFASTLVLLMTVTFVEHLLAWVDPWATLTFAGAILVVSVAIVGYTRFGAHEQEEK